MVLILPILIPLLTAALALLFWRHPRLQYGFGLVGSAALLVASIALLLRVQWYGIQVAQMGNWPAPFGITLVADHLAALMVLVTAVIGAAVTVYSLVDVDSPRQRFGYFPLLHVLYLGVSAAFLTGDVFNLYVWFEVLLISSFVLVALGSERAQLEGALKYVTLNLISSFLFLSGVGILYGAVGTLNMADASLKLQNLDNPDVVTTLAMLFLTSFGIKAALFPLFFWLPASYHTPPAAVSAIFAGLLTKVGVYALYRVFTLLFVRDVEFTHTILLIVSGLTMVTGVLGAVAQQEVRRILSFHIISQIGYMVLGLGLFTPLGLAAGIFYIIHHIIVKTNLFLVAGVIHKLRGTGNLKYVGGLYREAPWLAMLFAVPALSLAGMPPLSGFISKLALVQAAFREEQYLAVVVMLAVAVLTLYSMTKIWNSAFWQPKGDPPSPDEGVALDEPQRFTGREMWLLLFPIVALATLTILIGVRPQWLYSLSESAAHELLDPVHYIDAVMENSL